MKKSKTDCAFCVSVSGVYPDVLFDSSTISSEWTKSLDLKKLSIAEFETYALTLFHFTSTLFARQQISIDLNRIERRLRIRVSKPPPGIMLDTALPHVEALLLFYTALSARPYRLYDYQDDMKIAEFFSELRLQRSAPLISLYDDLEFYMRMFASTLPNEEYLAVLTVKRFLANPC